MLPTAKRTGLNKRMAMEKRTSGMTSGTKWQNKDSDEVSKFLFKSSSLNTILVPKPQIGTGAVQAGVPAEKLGQGNVSPGIEVQTIIP